MTPHALQVCGIRGLPARHGGFETFAERLALYLSGNGWRVTVYCQVDTGQPPQEHLWEGVRLIDIPVRGEGPLSTILFDLKSVVRSCREPGPVLTLGYNTAVFSALYRIRGIRNLINMDGIEWKRDKWGTLARAWFFLNERAGALFADHLIADHPQIAEHLRRFAPANKITMIPYGADAIDAGDPRALLGYGLDSGSYALIVARPEPENSILQMVRAFSRRPRGLRLVVLGTYVPAKNSYHAAVMAAASAEVVFPGAIYDQQVVGALRKHALLYLHGHQVGGTNPSLVEALAAGSPILAHDNQFNRWVAGDQAAFFRDEQGCANLLDELLADPRRLKLMSAASRRRHARSFTWEAILKDYEDLLRRFSTEAPCVRA